MQENTDEVSVLEFRRFLQSRFVRTIIRPTREISWQDMDWPLMTSERELFFRKISVLAFQ